VAIQTSSGGTPLPALGKTPFWHELSKNKLLYIMFLPVAAYFITLAYIPMAGIIVAFKEYNYRDGIYRSPWIGFTNFRYFLVSGKALQVTRNTFLYNMVFIVCYNFFSILTAILIFEATGKRFKKVSQTLLFLPYFISWVTVNAFLYNLFNYEYGLINMVIKSFGGNALDIYGNPSNWYFLLPVLYIWKWVGFGSVLYLAALSGIDLECYEAATIDGATAFQRIRHITLPLLRPTIFILVLLGVGRIMRGEFDMFYQLIGKNGSLLDATDIIDTLVFRSLVGQQDFGMASASGLYQSVLCFVIIMLVNWMVRRYEKDYALF
jgi:putative aldouronate transport system permease protein